MSARAQKKKPEEPSYFERLRALNAAAYAAFYACQTEDERKQLLRVSHMTDKLVDGYKGPR
mgnify:CR=1 FL=1